MNSRRPASAATAKPLPSALPKVGQVGLDAVQGLRTAEVPAEAGDHLVQDEQRAVPRGTRSRTACEEAGGGSHCVAASMITQAIAPGCAANSASSAAEVVVGEA